MKNEAITCNEQNGATTMDPTAAADHWERLADEDEAMAEWDRDHGIDRSPPGQSAGDYRAASYRAIAKVLRLEAATGKPHCSICFGDHPNHHHAHRG